MRTQDLAFTGSRVSTVAVSGSCLPRQRRISRTRRTQNTNPDFQTVRSASRRVVIGHVWLFGAERNTAVSAGVRLSLNRVVTSPRKGHFVKI